MSDRRKRKVLFLCTGNSARSILGEYLLRAMDARFETYSAGAEPTGKVHPMALQVLREGYGIDAGDAESKSWEAVQDVDFDVVITVCDHARDTCPMPGSSAVQAHWGSPDPAAAGADEAEAMFRSVAAEIHGRLERFCALPWDRLGDVPLASLREDAPRASFRQDAELIEQLRSIGAESAD